MRSALWRRVGALVASLALLAVLVVASPVLAAGITVNSLADTAADDGVCTLREAIASANSDTTSGATAGECAAGAGADTITFSVAGTITLASGLPPIASDVVVDGANAITVDGNSSTRVVEVQAGHSAVLSGITISGGSDALGGGILNDGQLTLSDSTITGNQASLIGGGLQNTGTATVTNTTFSGNSAVVGGAINSTGTLTITGSAIVGNSAGNFGGGIENDGGVLTMTDSTIAGNSTGNIGAGIDSNNGTVTVVGSTFTNNTPGNGGGALALFGGTADLGNVTVAFNAEDQIGIVGATAVIRNATVIGGDIGILASGSETVIGSLIAGNTIDVLDSIETSTANLVGVPGGMALADILDSDGLADNGGPTETIALTMAAGNPAIDAGDSATCAAAPISGVDQRGMPRPAACDIGAYEAQPPTIAAHADVSAAATSAAGAAVAYTPPVGTDEQGGTATVGCIPASGSTFAVGSTTVTCTATDAVGHTVVGTFRVVVAAFAAPTVSASPAPTPAASQLPDTSGGAGGSGGSALLAMFALLSLATTGMGMARSRRSRRPAMVEGGRHRR